MKSIYHLILIFYLDVPYEIVVYTGDVSGAGTDSNVYISLYGAGGVCTEETFLTSKKKNRKDCFNRGSVDVFVREVYQLLLCKQYYYFGLRHGTGLTWCLGDGILRAFI